MPKKPQKKLREYKLSWPVYDSYKLVDRDKGLRLLAGCLKKKDHFTDYFTEEDFEHWASFESSLLSEGFIIANTRNKPRYYNPLESDELINDFIASGKDRRQSELDFVRKYGLLGCFKQEDILTGLDLQHIPNALSPYDKKIEPLAFFKAERNVFIELVEIYRNLKRPDPATIIRLLESSLSQTTYWNEWKAIWEADQNLYRSRIISFEDLVDRVKEKQIEWVKEDGLKFLYHLLIIKVDERLKTASIRPYLDTLSLNPIQFSWGYTCPSLLDSFYLKLWLKITGQTELRECKGCPIPFFPDEIKKGRPKLYHSTQCGGAARQRKRRKIKGQSTKKKKG